jgi:hypothetical protein
MPLLPAVLVAILANQCSLSVTDFPFHRVGCKKARVTARLLIRQEMP